MSNLLLRIITTSASYASALEPRRSLARILRPLRSAALSAAAMARTGALMSMARSLRPSTTSVERSSSSLKADFTFWR